MTADVFTGEVIAIRSGNTAVIKVSRFVADKKYAKRVTHSRKFIVDRTDVSCHIGDRVNIISTKPISKTKFWRIVNHTGGEV